MLTKSQYLVGRHCAKRLWLARFAKELAAAPTRAEDERRRTGDLLGQMAREVFPGGVLVEAPWGEQVEATRDVLAGGAETVFEAAFEADGLFARCDVLERVGTGWRVTEVKSSTKVREEHLEDLAFQVHVLRRAGLEVVAAAVCHIDSSKSRGAIQLTPHELFVVEDVTAAVERVVPTIADEAAGLLRVLEQAAPPDVPTNVHCLSPYKCPFYEHCHAGQPALDVVKLPGIRFDRVVEFREAGYPTIDLVPEDAPLSPAQRKAWEVVRFDQPYVNTGLGAALAGIQFPAHFIDFEAAGPALPVHPGTRPYQAFPFQWSDHRLDAPDAEPAHAMFLHREPGDPRAAFAATLYERIREAGTVVFYSSYELTTVKGLAAAGVPFADELVRLLERRGFDLYKVVKDDVYLAGFEGSFSIKKVLPVLVPDLSYDGLAIQDGDTAAVEYLRMHALGTTEAERDEIAAALEAYCAVDTLAMVRLYQALRALIA